MYLARRGSSDHLDESGMVCPKINLYSRLHQTLQPSFSNPRSFQTKPEQNYNEVILCYVVLETVPVSCLIGLIQLTKPARTVRFTSHGSLGVKGRRGSKVP